LSNVVIKAKISQKQAKITEKLGITQERVVAELAALAFSDITAVTRIKNGSFSILDTDEWEPYSRANVKSIRETTTEAGGSLSCEMHDKLTALKLLGSHLGMWKEKDADGNKGSSSIDLDSVRRLVREVRK
jgi:phage terminase small subunit